MEPDYGTSGDHVARTAHYVLGIIRQTMLGTHSRNVSCNGNSSLGCGPEGIQRAQVNSTCLRFPCYLPPSLSSYVRPYNLLQSTKGKKLGPSSPQPCPGCPDKLVLTKNGPPSDYSLILGGPEGQWRSLLAVSRAVNNALVHSL